MVVTVATRAASVVVAAEAPAVVVLGAMMGVENMDAGVELKVEASLAASNATWRCTDQNRACRCSHSLRRCLWAVGSLRVSEWGRLGGSGSNRAAHNKC